MNEECNKKYQSIIIDSVNLFYRVCNTEKETPVMISQKSVYKNSICNFIKQVEFLKDNFLYKNGTVYLLFDNYFSRADLQTSFTYADRKSIDESYKATRKKENKPFYQSLNFIRYYYIIGPSCYKTARIDGLEADDLVKPLIDGECKDKSCLFVTNDLDWCRYLSDNIDWFPNFGKLPETKIDVAHKLGFPVTETNIIVYKALFGDASDNIKNIVPVNDSNIKMFIDMVDIIKFPDKLIYLSRNHEYIEKYPLLQYVYDNERQYQINCQLVSSIQCSSDTLNDIMYTGHNDEVLYKVVREALELDVTEKKFIFGKVKRPRK